MNIRQQNSDVALQLADWRRRIGELYVAVRNANPPYSGWLLWRAGREELFRRHPQSPVRDAGSYLQDGIPFYEYDPKLRFNVGITPLNSGLERAMDLPEGTVRMHPALRTNGLEAKLGRELTIYWIDGYGGGLFLAFRDGTAGGDTYGGGRYLIDTIKGADLGMTGDGRLILDFNFAYHPSCAYSNSWVCPLAPRENWLSFPVLAGEQL